MGSLQVRCAVACDALRRARELVAMAESAAPMHAVSLARVRHCAAPRDVGARAALVEGVAQVQLALAAQRSAVDEACAELAGALAMLEDDVLGDARATAALAELSLTVLTAQVAKRVAAMLERARDADAEVDDVLARELDVERSRWLALVPASAARVCDDGAGRIDESWDDGAVLRSALPS